MDKLIADADLHVSMVFFNHVATVRRISKHERPIDVARTVQPRYQTNFEDALDKVRQAVNISDHDNVRVMFMTDGMANKGDSIRGLARFSQWAAAAHPQTDVSVDVMAFQTSENVSFLEQLRCGGTTQGIYRYCQRPADLELMLGEIFSLIGVRSTAVRELALELPAGCTAIGTATSDGVPTQWPLSPDGARVDVALWVRMDMERPHQRQRETYDDDDHSHAQKNDDVDIDSIAVVANGVPYPVDVCQCRSHTKATYEDRILGRVPSFRAHPPARGSGACQAVSAHLSSTPRCPPAPAWSCGGHETRDDTP